LDGRDPSDMVDLIREGLGQNHEGHESHSLVELFIHQLIETIEFVLGTISNTASYLRLWALSLAHSQLASVFFENTIAVAMESESVIGRAFMLWFAFIMFGSTTFAILMCMDVLECFLHTLRLHWVEFQNKFYKGSGYKFEPFDITQILLT